MKQLEFYNCANVRYVGALNGAAFASDMTQLCTSRYFVYVSEIYDVPIEANTSLLSLFTSVYMEIEFNSFNSSIPSSVGSLPGLRFFYVRDSFISGNLDFMQGMQAIRK